MVKLQPLVARYVRAGIPRLAVDDEVVTVVDFRPADGYRTAGSDVDDARSRTRSEAAAVHVQVLVTVIGTEDIGVGTVADVPALGPHVTAVLDQHVRAGVVHEHGLVAVVIPQPAAAAYENLGTTSGLQEVVFAEDSLAEDLDRTAVPQPQMFGLRFEASAHEQLGVAAVDPQEPVVPPCIQRTAHLHGAAGDVQVVLIVHGHIAGDDEASVALLVEPANVRQVTAEDGMEVRIGVTRERRNRARGVLEVDVVG